MNWSLAYFVLVGILTVDVVWPLVTGNPAPPLAFKLPVGIAASLLVGWLDAMRAAG